MTFRSIKLLLSLPQISSFQSASAAKQGWLLEKRGDTGSGICVTELQAAPGSCCCPEQDRTQLSSALDAPTQEQPGPDAPAGHNLGTVRRQRIGEDIRSFVC